MAAASLASRTRAAEQRLKGRRDAGRLCALAGLDSSKCAFFSEAMDLADEGAGLSSLEWRRQVREMPDNLRKRTKAATLAAHQRLDELCEQPESP